METEDTKSAPRTQSHLPEGQVEERSATEDYDVNESRGTEKWNESGTEETLYTSQIGLDLYIFFRLRWGEELRRRAFLIFLTKFWIFVRGECQEITPYSSST